MTEAATAKRASNKPTTDTTGQLAKRGRKPTAEAKPYIPLDMSQITVTKVTDPDTMREHRRERAARDDDQLAIDSLVKQSHQRWVEAGKPDVWGECISASYTLQVPQAVQETIERRIKRAGTYFDVSVRFGKVKALENGFVQILFFAKDRSVKENGNKTEETVNDNGAVAADAEGGA